MRRYYYEFYLKDPVSGHSIIVSPSTKSPSDMLFDIKKYKGILYTFFLFDGERFIDHIPFFMPSHINSSSARFMARQAYSIFTRYIDYSVDDLPAGFSPFELLSVEVYAFRSGALVDSWRPSPTY